MVFVLLRPSTMEDEGRFQYLGKFGSQRQAEQFIDEEVERSKGWYSKGSYIIAKPI